MTDVTLILITTEGQTELRVEKNIEKLDLSGRQLIGISDNLTELCSLLELYCSYNQLTTLPALPASLLELYCSYDQLTSLPALPASLLKLDCSYDQLTSLPALPASLLKLDCSNNQLTSLPALPASLLELYCWNNQLTSLPALPASLLELYCWNNQLTSLPALPASLLKLYCSNNQLTTLPISLLQCRHLQNIIYSDNLIEYIPPALQRFLDQRTTYNAQSVYSDTQNVHSSSIQNCIRQSIYQLIEVKPSLSADQCLSSLLADEMVTSKTKELLVDYLNTSDTHSVLGITFQELFTSVWSVITTHPSSTEIKEILNQEIQDSECKCFTGRMSRLVNCLNGYDERVVVTISQPEQINALILMLMKKYQGEELKSHFRSEMTERGYQTEIDEWLGYLSQL